jgi:hypothetical protein
MEPAAAASDPYRMMMGQPPPRVASPPPTQQRYNQQMNQEQPGLHSRNMLTAAEEMRLREEQLLRENIRKEEMLLLRGVVMS